MSEPPPAKVGERDAAFIGCVISGRYRVGSLIASGGMGAVYRGEHVHMRKRVAIKILHAEMDGILSLAEQFEREAIAGAHITHPNVAIATDFGRLDDGSFFLVQEYLRGVTLAQVLEQGPLSVERALHIAKQVAGALHAVHALGIVHRDVKPANVMLMEGSNDHAKLIDFGFAKVPMERMSVARADDPLHDRDGMWDPDTMFGTVGYLAPEAAKGVDALDARSDLYALGVSMYEMFTGKRPFEAPKNAELFRLHLTRPAPPFVERAPMVPVPAAVEGVVLRLLAKDPAERYQNGQEVVAALNRVVAAKPNAFPLQPRVKLDSIEIPLPPRSRVRTVALVVALLGALGAIGWLVPPVRGWLRQWGLPVPSSEASEAASVRPAASQSPTEIDGLGAAAWTARLLAAPKAADWKGGATALGALAQLDPTALRVEAVANATAAVATGAAAAQADLLTADDVYRLLANRFGPDGLDVLYRIVEKQQPKHAAAVRAVGLLGQPEILGRTTPSLRIAFELRQAPCEKAAELFESAETFGDARARAVLERLRSRPCRRGTDPCCFRTNAALAKTIRALDARLKAR